MRCWPGCWSCSRSQSCAAADNVKRHSSVPADTVRSVYSAAALVLHPTIHAAEIARFWSYVVPGPHEVDCDIWVGAIGSDGYGRFRVSRGGCVFSIRPNRYALALANGGVLESGVLALHTCDNPICIRVSDRHVRAGTQSENMIQMVRMRRGGAQRPLRQGDSRGARRERSVALREAVRDGWDPAAVEAALIGEHPTLW